MLPQNVDDVERGFSTELPDLRPEYMQLMSDLLLGQTAIMETLDLLMQKLATFEQRAEPLLQRAEKRGRLFGGA